jgi:hypothetical protein
MAHTLYSETSESDKRVALNSALDERTDPIKLRQCKVDLRSYNICLNSWWENRILPRLYAISVSCNEATVDM